MIKHVIFDFDGTIADSKDLAINLYNEVADKHNLTKVKDEDINYFSSLSIIERCKLLNVPLYKIPMLAVELRKNYLESINMLKAFEGIKEVIWELLKEGYQLSIISSNSSDNIKQFLKNNQIDVFTSEYSASSIFGKDKKLSNFIKKYNLDSDEVIYIGDEHRDVDACKKSNVKVIAVTWGFDALELIEKANPDFIANTPKDILDVIKN
ncbi:MAG: HAD-IA family hydrolase [Firmicutes bacterium]|nr:HAD-IA family hydrolase [Bacillota bacterium]